jgi:hypothetical protein
MEASLDDAAFEVYLGLRNQRFNAMRNDVHHYLPHGHPKLGWGMMDRRNLEVIPCEMAHFIYELMEKNDRLQDMVVAQGKSLSRCQKVIDTLRVSAGSPRIYERLDHENHP